VVEIQGVYPRAHVSRFASVYSSGRVRYEISYPEDPTALALPMKSVRGLRGEEIEYSVFQSSPVPALTDFQVQPRSLAMFRGEAMVELGGGLQLVGGPADGTLINGTDLDLHDAVLIDTSTGEKRWLGDLGHWPKTDEERAAKGHEFELSKATVFDGRVSDAAKAIDWADVDSYLSALRDYRWNGPEDAGEVRLVAWAKDPHPGEVFTPSVDRHRGFRLVVAHLRFTPPDPSRPPYYDTAEPENKDDEDGAKAGE